MQEIFPFDGEGAADHCQKEGVHFCLSVVRRMFRKLERFVQIQMSADTRDILMCHATRLSISPFCLTPEDVPRSADDDPTLLGEPPEVAPKRLRGVGGDTGLEMPCAI